MIDNLNWEAASVFIAFFALVTVLGFVASRWKAGDLNQLHEWGLGGRRFGPWVTWFLLGGDLYTAYTVIAVPALVYAVGAFGFFAIPYTILIYPLLFAVFPKLWSVCREREYLTAGDFVLGHFGNRWLALAVAITGLVATMPYIALQLVGMEKVIEAMGFRGEGIWAHAPLTIAFIILAVYTYRSGLRAPAMIAFVKDIMIYIFVIAAVIVIPIKLGGYGAIFDSAGAAFEAKGGNTGLLLKEAQIWPYITLAVGSAMALFLYPHSLTGILAASGPGAIRRNAIALPAYSIVLAMIALLGLMGHAAGLKLSNPQDVVPQLFLKFFPDWFSGFAFAAIAIGALVPAAIMSIGAANTFTRNVWKPFVNPSLEGAEEAFIAKVVSVVVKVGALAVILLMPTKFAIDLQLLGGVWMIQIFPAIIFGLFTRLFSGWALLAGLIAGLASGTYLVWGPALTPIVPLGSVSVYAGLYALTINIAISASLSIIVIMMKRGSFSDASVKNYSDVNPGSS
ncbi:MAG: sodium:solute symporter family protein [Hyphomicrobiales bacterium]|nr:sodium:solute symporter family protein [Hyphomicrobiales bacterium]